MKTKTISNAEASKLKPAAPATPLPAKPNQLTIVLGGKSQERVITEVGLSPVVGSAITCWEFRNGVFDDINLNESISIVRERTEKVDTGDLSEVEATLTAQATTLDAIFNNLARRAAQNMEAHIGATDIYLRLALKAQSQCRTTIEAIAEIKYPKSATFIKQANIAGQQQVNNATGGQPAQEKNITPSNELLTESSHATLDSRGTGAAIIAHSELETVGAIDRAKHKRRKATQ